MSYIMCYNKIEEGTNNMIIIRGSEYQDFLQCRKKWYYSWYEKIEPKRKDNKLFFGTLFHKWLEHYYSNGCDDAIATEKTMEWYHNQDTSGMEEVELQEMMALFEGVKRNYHETYGEQDKRWKVLGTEVTFLVKLEEDILMTGTLDMVVENEEGKLILIDHKTVSSIQMYIEKSVMDRQISRYLWALNMLSSGVGRVLKDDTWVVWNEVLGKGIDSFIYNLIAKDFPKEPKVLKSGKLSTDKAQKTTYTLYKQAIQRLGLSENDYTDILEYLKQQPDRFLKRLQVIRTGEELEASVWEFFYTAKEIKSLKEVLQVDKTFQDRLCYRHIGHHCMTMCGYRPLCQTAIEGGNVDLMKVNAYQPKEEM